MPHSAARHTHYRVFTALLVAGLLAAGCASYETRDAYRQVAGPMPPAPHFSQLPSAGFGIASDTRSALLGLFGIPILPTALSTTEAADTLVLRVFLQPRADQAFSVAAAPCFLREDGSALCPERSRVTAAMTTQPGPHRSESPPPIHSEETLVHPGNTPTDARLDRARLLRGLTLPKRGPWAWMRIDVLHLYRCGRPCPARLRLQGASVVEIDGVPVQDGEVTYLRERQREYNPAVQVQ